MSESEKSVLSKDPRVEIAEYQRTQEALQENRRVLSTLISNLPGVVYRCQNDSNWTLEFVSEGIHELTGYRPADFIDARRVSYGQLIHPEDRKRVWQEVQAATQGRQPYRLIYRLRTADGVEKWAWEQGRGVFALDGQLLALEGFITDITEQKRTEDLLRQREHQFKALVENASDIIVRFDQDLRHVYANPALARVTGIPLHELIGKTNQELGMPTDLVTYWGEHLRRVFEKGKEAVIQFDFVTPQGQRHYQSRIVPEVADDGSIASVLSITRDLTELRQAEEGVRRERDFTERLIETAQAIVLVLDPEGRIVRFNPYMEELSGYRLEEVRGKDWFPTFLPERDQGRLQDVFLKAVHDLDIRGNVNPIVTKEGQERVIEWSAKTLKDALGNIVGVVSIGQDLTERRRMEEAIHRNEAWLSGLIETTQDAIISIDRQGRIVLFNPAAERMFGYTRAEVAGHRVNLLMAEPYASEHDAYIRRYEQTGEARAIGRIRTVTARRKDGERFPIELSVTEVQTDEEVHYGAFIRDISEKVRLQEQVLERERLATIGTTAATLGHEIGNPLNGMALSAQLLARRLAKLGDSLDERTLSYVRNIQHEIQRLTHLLTEFRSLSRRQPFTFHPVSVDALITELLTAETPHYTARGVQVEWSCASGLPLVVADTDKLRQVLLNLCKNAVEAMPEGGILTVRAHNAGEHVTVEIVDTGPGIPEGLNVFEPFATTKAEGTGLGLAIAQQIVSAHGGRLSYTTAPGQGTTFTVVLPLKPPGAAAGEPERLIGLAVA